MFFFFLGEPHFSDFTIIFYKHIGISGPRGVARVMVGGGEREIHYVRYFRLKQLMQLRGTASGRNNSMAWRATCCWSLWSAGWHDQL